MNAAPSASAGLSPTHIVKSDAASDCERGALALSLPFWKVAGKSAGRGLARTSPESQSYADIGVPFPERAVALAGRAEAGFA